MRSRLHPLAALAFGALALFWLAAAGLASVAGREAAPPGLMVLALALLGTLLAAACAAAARRAYRRSVEHPLREFETALEDLAEGFLVESVPHERLQGAEPRIVSAFERVFHINRMMSRTVDNLERGFEEERLAKERQAALTRAYERFVPHEFISFLNKDSILGIRLGDHVRMDMTILFSDIRSFTALSERLSAEENFKLLNAYLRRMDPVVKRYGGFIDKYIGDAVMGLFHGGADVAVRAATEMLKELGEYNEELIRSGHEPIRIGIGLNTGAMMLGIVGGDSRMEGTVISDAVNVASRLEELNKRYGTSILIGETTFDSLRDPQTRSWIRLIDRVTVAGKSQPVAVYEVFEADEPALRSAKQSTRAAFEQAVEHIGTNRPAEALRALSACAANDTAAQVLRRRCENILQGGATG
jgi:class 3 adenylate cyclase